MKNEIVKGATPSDSATAKDGLFNARLLTSGAFLATTLIDSYVAKSVAADAIFEAVTEQIKTVNQGDLTQVEAMLLGQAIALQGMFLSLADRAKRADSLEKVQCLTQLALRSQAGSRSTLQTLADVKNPRQVAFVKQTNVAQTQQVNNGVSLSSHAEDTQAEPNKLLVEDPDGSTKMDTRAKTTAGRAHKDLVPVEQINRTDKPRRKAKRVP